MAASTDDGRRDPLPLVLVVLTVTTGLVDAISVLGLGRVFTANMTGNVVFFGFAVGGAKGFEAPRYIVALAAFLAGAALGGMLGKALSGATRRRWLLTVAVVECGLLGAAALVAIGYDIESLVPTAKLYALILLTALAMGLRNATVRQLRVPDLTTTVLTLTLTGLAADSSIAGGGNVLWGRRLAAVLSILVGAIIGTVLVITTGLSLPLAVTGLFVLIATAAYALHPASRIVAGKADR
jgi:uncharacterized membrane protein YoaK (UPF0700 family)